MPPKIDKPLSSSNKTIASTQSDMRFQAGIINASENMHASLFIPETQESSQSLFVPRKSIGFYFRRFLGLTLEQKKERALKKITNSQKMLGCLVVKLKKHQLENPDIETETSQAKQAKKKEIKLEKLCNKVKEKISAEQKKLDHITNRTIRAKVQAQDKVDQLILRKLFLSDIKEVRDEIKCLKNTLEFILFNIDTHCKACQNIINKTDLNAEYVFIGYNEYLYEKMKAKLSMLNAKLAGLERLEHATVDKRLQRMHKQIQELELEVVEKKYFIAQKNQEMQRMDERKRAEQKELEQLKQDLAIQILAIEKQILDAQGTEEEKKKRIEEKTKEKQSLEALIEQNLHTLAENKKKFAESEKLLLEEIEKARGEIIEKQKKIITIEASDENLSAMLKQIQAEEKKKKMSEDKE